jgi:hypothetical protein
MQSLTPTETHSLSYDTQTLSSQLQTVLSMCKMYEACCPLFGSIASSLSQHDSNVLYSSLSTHSYNLCQFLKYPLPTVIRASTISFITNLDIFIVTFLFEHVTSSQASKLLGFSNPIITTKPSVIYPVS